MLSQPAPNYTRTLSTQIVFLIIVGIAVDAWVRRFPNKLTYALVGLIFAGNLVWTVRDYFFVWPSNREVRFWHQSGLYAVAQNVQRDPDTSPLVVCVPDYLIDERTRGGVRRGGTCAISCSDPMLTCASTTAPIR